MINSRNVDLTENSDFGKALNFNNIRIFDKDYFDSFKEYVKGGTKKNITSDEYDAYDTYIRIFGIHYHFTQFDYVFDKEWKFEKEIDEHCYRCGKPLRIPWRKNRGLCDECNADLLEKTPRISEPIDILSKCPWSKYTMQDSREMFSLR